jgi:hypothetical protein
MVITRIPRDAAGRISDYEVWDRPYGGYHTRVTGGQRPFRSGGPYAPVYMLTGERPVASNYRAELGRILTSDFQFARATANRVWAHLMGVGIVDPVDGFDPDRYQEQASHPQLLDDLARDFIESGYNLRHLVRRIVTSSAYQLSLRYPGEWQESSRRLFARRIARPLAAEEIHDSIVRVTGMSTMYVVDGFDNPVNWAMELPDTNEPRRGADALAFMRIFGRGNRLDQMRSTDSSILGSLSLMNSPFITTRVTAASSTNVVRLLQMQFTDEEMVNRMFLQTLSRRPNAEEMQAALAGRGANRTEWAEDLQWALLNKLDFLFSY